MYAEVAKLVAEDNVILAAVDCEQGSDTDFARSLPYNVTAYPTILYYQRGKLQFPYNHGHKKELGFTLPMVRYSVGRSVPGPWTLVHRSVDP